MSPVFADTSFWIALRDKRDADHKAAREISTEITRLRKRLVVTPYIFAETHAYFVRSVILRERIIRDFWENPIVHIETVTVEDRDAALGLLRERRDKDYSFCDALSFVVMERLHVQEAVSFDAHFRQHGKFRVLERP